MEFTNEVMAEESAVENVTTTTKKKFHCRTYSGCVHACACMGYNCAIAR